jgi:hypothetical protein
MRSLAKTPGCVLREQACSENREPIMITWTSSDDDDDDTAQRQMQNTPDSPWHAAGHSHVYSTRDYPGLYTHKGDPVHACLSKLAANANCSLSAYLQALDPYKFLCSTYRRLTTHSRRNQCLSTC